MRRSGLIALTVIGIVAAGLFASSQWTWWWHSEESFPDICRERCQFLTDAYFIGGRSPTDDFFVNLPTDDRRALATYLRFRCDTNRPESIRERAEWCLHAYTIPVLDPRRRLRSKAIATQIDWMASSVWNRISGGSRKVRALPFSEYVTLAHGLLPLLEEEDAAKIQKALRECFDLAITHIGFFDRCEMVETLIDAIQENNEQKKSDPERRAYQAKMAAQFETVAKSDDFDVITSSSGIDYRVRFLHSGGSQYVAVRRLDQLKAFGSFRLDVFKDIVAEGALDERVQAPTELGLEQIKWLRADPVAFPKKNASTASLCVVADTGGRVVGASLAARLLRASGLKGFHGPHVITLPPVIGKTDQESLHRLVADTVDAHDKLTHIHLDLVAHGDKEGIHLSESPIVAEDFVRLAEQHPEITFLITTPACYSGDQAVALEHLLQERADEKLSKQLTLITQSSPGAATLQSRYGGYYALCFLRCLDASVINYGRAASQAARAVEYWNTPLIVHSGKLYRL